MSDEKTFSFTLTLKQLDTLATALGELPMKIALPVLQEIQRQFAAQTEVKKE